LLKSFKVVNKIQLKTQF